MKQCCRFKTGKCKAEMNPQSEDCFAKDRKRKDGLTVHCKSCLKEYRETNKDQRNETIKNWRLTNPDKVKEYRIRSADKNNARAKKWREKNSLKFRYNISNEDWQEMFNKQEGKCRICFIHAKDLKRGLAVDHCHDSKKVRGLLCHSCNMAIGLMKHDVSIINHAISYLSEHQ